MFPGPCVGMEGSMKENPPTSNPADSSRPIRVALAFCGVLGVVVLAAETGVPEVRVAAAAVGILAIISLAWSLRRQVGESSREAEILARRLVEERDDLEARLKEEHEQHATLERYFAAVMEHIPANLYFKDLDSRFLRVNQRMAERFGCGHPADMTGKTDHDFFDTKHANEALDDETAILNTGRGIEGKLEHETFADGSESWVLTSKLPFRESSGRIIGTFGMSSDVTELMQTRNTLEKERNMLRSLIDSIPDRIFVRDPDRHYLLVNRAMAQAAGLDSPAAMIGRRPEDFFPRTTLAAAIQEDLDLLAGDRDIVTREWQHERDGETRTIITTKVPWFDAEGRCHGIVGLDRDVTDSRIARARITESETRLQEVMDNSPAVVSMKDPEGRYLMVNRGFEEMFGLTRADILGRSDHDLLGDKEAAAVIRERDLQVIAAGAPLHLDEKFFVDGQRRWYATVRFPLRDASGRIHAIGGIATDVTDRREAEDSMRKLNDDLVQANHELQRAHEQLIHAEKMESVGRLASGVAHEVKNPLAMIGMGLELLARRLPSDDETARETLERMRRGVDRANTIVRGLVDFSSARQFEKKPAAIHPIIRDAVALVDYQLRKARVTLHQDLAPELPEVEVDATKIEQVLVNLLINAMQAMEDGGEITIRTRLTRLHDIKRDEGVRTSRHLRQFDRVVLIEIEDTGPGIDPANLPRLYDPFFTTKPTGIGTGLGLSVSRKIIELHQGTLDLMNREDHQGARARIILHALAPAQ